MLRGLFLSALICAFPLYPIHVPFHRTLKPHPNISAPWFTGPLLAPSALTIPFGHYNIEPYIYGLANTGAYDGHWQPVKKENFWNNYFQTLLAFGVNNWADFQCNPTLFYNYSDSSRKMGARRYADRLRFSALPSDSHSH